MVTVIDSEIVSDLATKARKSHFILTWIRILEGKARTNSYKIFVIFV